MLVARAGRGRSSASCGLSSVGAVVGATHPRAVGEARKLLPQAILLLPGVGAQGATPADIARAFTSGPASALVAASRSVMYAFRDGEDDWRAAAGGGGRAAESRGVDSLRLVGRRRVGAPRAGRAVRRRHVLVRYAAPAAFLLVVTVVALARCARTALGRSRRRRRRPPSSDAEASPTATPATPAPPKRVLRDPERRHARRDRGPVRDDGRRAARAEPGRRADGAPPRRSSVRIR